jgi:CHASE2 domain-containing sensor protein
VAATLYARAIDALVEARPRVIALEVFFDSARPEDAALADAIRRAPGASLEVPARRRG